MRRFSQCNPATVTMETGGIKTGTTITIQMSSTLPVSVRTTVAFMSTESTSFRDRKTSHSLLRTWFVTSATERRNSLCRGRPRGDRTIPACRPAVGRRPWESALPPLCAACFAANKTRRSLPQPNSVIIVASKCGAFRRHTTSPKKRGVYAAPHTMRPASLPRKEGRLSATLISSFQVLSVKFLCFPLFPSCFCCHHCLS